MVDIKELAKYSKSLNVLYVEDDKQFAKDTIEIFENFFLNVDLSINGEDALLKYLQYFDVNHSYYDIIITDISMPKLNGLELVKTIYEHNKIQLIIVISAHNEAEYLVEFINIGIEYFIVKPFDIDEIIQVLCKSSMKIYTSKQNNNNIISLANDYTWNKKESSLYYKSDFVKLTKKEILFFEIVIDNLNAVSKIDYILDTIWQDSIDNVTVGMLNPLISRLKKKLPQELIQSIYGVGYKIISKENKDNT